MTANREKLTSTHTRQSECKYHENMQHIRRILQRRYRLSSLSPLQNAVSVMLSHGCGEQQQLSGGWMPVTTDDGALSHRYVISSLTQHGCRVRSHHQRDISSSATHWCTRRLYADISWCRSRSSSSSTASLSCSCIASTWHFPTPAAIRYDLNDRMRVLRALA